MITFQNGKIKNEIRYKLDIQFLKNQNESNVYKLDRSNDIFINDKAPDNYIDQLAFETSKIMYPLEMVFFKDGSIKSIHNYNEIKERWVKAKKKIHNYYKGEIAEKYLKHIDNTLKFEEEFIRKLSKDWFIYMYFIPLSIDNFNKIKIAFPTAGKAIPIDYKITKTIEERPDADDIFIKIKGEIDDERCALDLEQELDYPYFKNIDKNEKNLDGTCDIIYSLNPKTRMVEGIDATFYTEYLEPKKIEIKMFLLETISKEKKR